ELAVLYDQPCPSGTEPANASRRKLFLKCGKGTEARGDGRSQIAFGLPAPALFHQRPEERMVPVSAAIVANCRANRLGHCIQIFQEIVDRFGLQVRTAIQGFVQISDICPMMCVVVNLHGLRVDMRLERVESVRQRWHCEWHWILLRYTL